jgi:hypothetical protein
MRSLGIFALQGGEVQGKARWRKLKGIAKVEFSDGYDVRDEDSLVRSSWDSARKNTKSSGSSSDREAGVARFVLCVRNRDYPASLELRKV